MTLEYVPEQSKEQLARRAGDVRSFHKMAAMAENNFAKEDTVLFLEYPMDSAPATWEKATETVDSFLSGLAAMLTVRGRELRYLYCTREHGDKPGFLHKIMLNLSGDSDLAIVRTSWPGIVSNVQRVGSRSIGSWMWYLYQGTDARPAGKRRWQYSKNLAKKNH